MLFTRSTGVLVDGDGCVYSALSPENPPPAPWSCRWLSERVVLLTPFSQGTHLLSVGHLKSLSVIRAYHLCGKI